MNAYVKMLPLQHEVRNHNRMVLAATSNTSLGAAAACLHLGWRALKMTSQASWRKRQRMLRPQQNMGGAHGEPCDVVYRRRSWQTHEEIDLHIRLQIHAAQPIRVDDHQDSVHRCACDTIGTLIQLTQMVHIGGFLNQPIHMLRNSQADSSALTCGVTMFAPLHQTRRNELSAVKRVIVVARWLGCGGGGACPM